MLTLHSNNIVNDLPNLKMTNVIPLTHTVNVIIIIFALYYFIFAWYGQVYKIVQKHQILLPSFII